MNLRSIVLRREHGEPFELTNADSFKLMAYQSEATGRIEWIWNSRDGVTPFGTVDHLAEEGANVSMKHIRWGEDVIIPNFVPPIGSRIFMSYDQAPADIVDDIKARWAERLKEAEEAGHEVPEEAKSGPPFGIRDDAPVNVVVDEALHQHFLSLARDNPFVPAGHVSPALQGKPQGHG